VRIQLSMSIVHSADHPDNRIFLLIIPSIIRYRPRLSVIRFRRIDFPPKNHNPSELGDIAYCSGSLVIWDRIRRDRRSWIMVASSRIGCERWSRHIECESQTDACRGGVLIKKGPSPLLSSHLSVYPPSFLVLGLHTIVSSFGKWTRC
jgi:hypothetical protein